MRFIDLFAKKPAVNTDNLVVNISDGKITVNGLTISIPCHMSAVRKILGKPRVCRTKSKNIIHTYDKLGIYFYTKGNSVVKCVELKTKETTRNRKHEPKQVYKGILTIEGEPWEEYMSSGENTGITRCHKYELYKIHAVYADQSDNENNIHEAYSSLSIEI